jgi:O-antigen ligase
MMSSNLIYISLGILLIILSLANLYWGTFFVILAQPLFFTASSGAGIGATKVVYGVLFALWFTAWGLSRLLGRSGKSPQVHSMAAPALAFGAWLVLAIPLGLAYGASFKDVTRDLSQFVGYLTVLPLLDLVQTPKQAKRLIFFLALLGLPSFIFSEIHATAVRQQINLPVHLQMFANAGQYWEPVQGALWAVALSFPGFAVKLVAWVWLLFMGALSLFSGIRHLFVMFLLAALTAFIIAGRLARQKLARYLILFMLILMVGGVVADLSGMVKLPISDITRDRYSTMMSAKGLEQDRSMEGRFKESRWLLGKFLQNPVTGIGLGHGMDDPTIPGGYNFMFHNSLLAILMKFGLVGGAIFAWYFLRLFRLAFEVVRTGDSYFARAIGLGMVIWLVPALAASTVGGVLTDRGFALTVGVMAGLLPGLAFSRQPAVVENGQVTEPAGTSALEIQKGHHAI